MALFLFGFFVSIYAESSAFGLNLTLLGLFASRNSSADIYFCYRYLYHKAFSGPRRRRFSKIFWWVLFVFGLWKLYISFFISCSINFGGVSTYARYHIILRITWFITSFLPIKESLRLFQLAMSFCIFFLILSQFLIGFSLPFCPYMKPRILIFLEFHLTSSGFDCLPMLVPIHILKQLSWLYFTLV